MIGKAKLLKVYVGERERYRNKPLYQHLVTWLKEQGYLDQTGQPNSQGNSGKSNEDTARGV
ncbi:MAG: DUF190 domain-containing protein [Desulfitobacteriaceae bacterium]